MNIYTIKKRELFTNGPHLLGLIFIAGGIFVLLSPLFIDSNNSLLKALLVGFGAISFGLIVVFTYEGTMIDFDKCQYKNFQSIAGYKIGQWILLPNQFTGIKVYSESYRSTRAFDGIHPSMSGKASYYKVAIYATKTKPFFSYEFSDRAKALDVAKVFSKNLTIPLDIRLENKKDIFELKK